MSPLPVRAGWEDHLGSWAVRARQGEGPLRAERQCVRVYVCAQMGEVWVEAHLSGIVCVSARGGQAGALLLGCMSAYDRMVPSRV